MEVAAGGAGDRSVTPDVTGPRAPGRGRLALNALLYVLVLGTASLVVALAVALWRGDDSPLPGLAAAEQAPTAYVEAQQAAEREAEAFVNIRYDGAQDTIDAVMAGATGDFRSQFEESTDGVVQVLRANRSVMTGQVVWSGVVAADDAKATVIVATSGTVANRTTDGEPVARTFRLRLELVREDGTWKTSDLQFVG